MSMNFNPNPKPTPEPEPKKNRTNEIVLALVMVGIVIAVVIFALQNAYKMNENWANTEPTTTIITTNLEQKLFDKCQNLQDWYRSLDGFEGTDYHCDKYAKAWSGLASN